jgi:hypothetical protein
MKSIQSEQTQNNLYQSALDYAKRGWHVFPLHTIINGKCSCDNSACTGNHKGKHPLTAHGVKDATTDPALIRQWWSEAPQANVGIATGPKSGFFVIGPDGQAGIDALAELERQYGPLPPTPRSRTGSGGRHNYFAWPPGRVIKNAANCNGLPIDVRGAGGYVVAPPSLHWTGNSYLWEIPPEEVPLAPAPVWLLDWLANGKGRTRKRDKTMASVRGTDTALPRSSASDSGGDTALPRSSPSVLTVQTEATADALSRAIAYLHKCPPAISGQGGHDQTFAVARAIVYGFNLGPEVGYDLLSKHFNPRCLPPWSEKELQHKCEEADTQPFDKPRGYLLQNEVMETASSLIASDSVDEIERLPMPPPAPWPKLPPEALHGLAGEIVGTIAPQTESDPVAILGQQLAAFGNSVGRKSHFMVEGDSHHTNLFLCLVGESARARKGTSRGRVMQVMSVADDAWAKGCVTGGLTSGEGLIWCVRDPIQRNEPIKEKGRVTGYQMVVADEGVTDKRLFVVESEFAQVLRVLQREGNSLSPIIRQSWDTGNLRTLTKNNPARATGAHVSVTAHITRPELAKYLKYTEALNGFANRFIWLACRRSQLLPDGGQHLDLSPLGARLKSALEKARQIGKLTRSEAAGKSWREVYPELVAERPGLYGAVTGRAEAQVLRLSMTYALMDTSAIIGVEHLRAALAFWSIGDASAKMIFGAEPDDPLPGLVLEKIQQSTDGLTRTQLRDAFHRNIPSKDLLAALAKLRDRGNVWSEEDRRTGGRPAERWLARGNAITRKAPLPVNGTIGDTALSRTHSQPAGANGRDTALPRSGLGPTDTESCDTALSRTSPGLCSRDTVQSRQDADPSTAGMGAEEVVVV